MTWWFCIQTSVLRCVALRCVALRCVDFVVDFDVTNDNVLSCCSAGRSSGGVNQAGMACECAGWADWE